jgi:uncharacterized membrane protein YphA (DoxX/SURF4 family)
MHCDGFIPRKGATVRCRASNVPTMQQAVTGARLLVAVILGGAGILKIGHATALAAALAGFRLLPADAIPLLAVLLPLFEVFVAVYLLAGLFTRIAGYVAATMFLSYAAAIASAVVRHIPANCGCFGPADAATADWPHAGFDLALAALALFIALRAPGAFALDRKWNVK